MAISVTPVNSTTVAVPPPTASESPTFPEPSTTEPSGLPVPAGISLAHSDSDTNSGSDSDSSTDYYIPSRSPKMTGRSDGLAHIQQASSKVPPTLTEGRITPEILHRWERACLNYFRRRKVKDSDCVGHVFFRIKDLCLSLWVENNESHLEGLSFAEFMTDLRKEALGTNWARSLRIEILRVRQDDRVFFDWVRETERKNAILVPVPAAHISDQRLRDHFEVHMNDALAHRCQRNSIISITDYREWTRAVKQEDELLRQHLEITRSICLNILASNKSRNTASSSSTSAPSPSYTMPKLSKEEKKILVAHDGCFKCRRPYVGHRTRECPNGFPRRYQRVTTAMAEAVRDERNRTIHVTPVLGSVLQLDGELPSAVLGSGSEVSDDSDDF